MSLPRLAELDEIPVLLPDDAPPQHRRAYLIGFGVGYETARRLAVVADVAEPGGPTPDAGGPTSRPPSE